MPKLSKTIESESDIDKIREAIDYVKTKYNSCDG